MIPKTVHFCWLSGDPYPSSIQKCLDTWQKHLPDYEFVLWDTNRFNLDEHVWVKQAFEAKKYAFAADYIRLYAVYHYGGIYMDTDVEVVKPFDDLLHRPYFVGAEGDGIIEAGVFGAQKHTSWLKPCLEYYTGKSFIKADGSLDTWTLPRIMMQQISTQRDFKEVLPNQISPENQETDQDTLYMFPKDFFCAKNHGTGVIEKTQNTYSVHHFAMSWIPKNHTFLPNLKRKLMGVLGVNTVNTIIKVLRLERIKNALKK